MKEELILSYLEKILHIKQIYLKHSKREQNFFHLFKKRIMKKMADIINDMTGKELYNMKMCKRLRLAKSIVRIEEQPIIDQLIGQFSNDYENPTPLMYA